MEELPPPQEKKLPAPNEKPLRSPIFREKYGKTAKWLVISFVLLVIVLSSSTMLLQSQKSTTIPAQPTQLPIPTANWKIYKNEGYGFEIKYPQNFYAQEGNYDSKEEYRQYWIEAADSKWKDQMVHNPSLIIDVIKTDLSPKQYLDKTGSSQSMLNDTDPCISKFIYCSVKDIKETNVGIENLSALQFYSAAVSGSDYHTIVRHSEFLIDIRAHSSAMGDFSIDTYNQILSTFKPKIYEKK